MKFSFIVPREWILLSLLSDFSSGGNIAQLKGWP